VPSPIFRINGGTAGVKASVSASSSVTCTLDSTDGVRSVTWSVIGTDETRTAASYTLVQSGSVGQTITFTAGATGTALIVAAQINGGINLQTEQADPTTRATGKVYVPTSGGLEVACVNEQLESSASHGWTGVLNGAVRNAGGGGGSPEDVDATPDTLALRGADGEVHAVYLVLYTDDTPPTVPGEVRVNAAGEVVAWSPTYGVPSPLLPELERPFEWADRFGGGATSMDEAVLSMPDASRPAVQITSALWVPEFSQAAHATNYTTIYLVYRFSADPLAAAVPIMTTNTSVSGWTGIIGVSLTEMFEGSSQVPAGAYLTWAMYGAGGAAPTIPRGRLFVRAVRQAIYTP
jgi:hypothetical protein